MADSTSMVMSQAEISALKDTLCAQQKLLQKLYNELDAEREASATAASEALSVILRLQGEKAAVKMEAEQYKRLAEEKMCHAEESFAIIEDIIYQKEMEVAAMDYQVQAYRYKLLSMGCDDPGGGEIKFPENLLQRNENVAGGDTSFHNSISRRNSAPILLKYRKALIERESSTSPEMDLIGKSVDEQTGEEIKELRSDSDKKNHSSVHGGISSYGEQIRKLDILVKEIAGANYVSSRNEIKSPSSISSRLSSGNLRQEITRSPSPQLSIGNLNKVAVVNEIDRIKLPENSRGKGEADYYNDVFEVPEADQSCKSYHESSTKDKKKTVSGGGEFMESRDLVHPEAVKLYGKDEPDWLNKLLQPNHHEKSLCKPSGVGDVVQPTSSVAESQSSLIQVNRISEIERVAESTNREEELKLLKEIKEKINLLHVEIKCQKERRSSTREKPSLNLLSEGMLYFWL